jgi:hypothetical protein
MKGTTMSGTKWGYTAEDIERAVEEVRRILIGVARDRRREGITYTALTEKMTTISVDPYSALLNEILGQVSEEGHLNGDGMLSVLVHYKDPEKGLWPGPGFFNLATKHLGYHLPDDPSKVAFWLEKRREVLDRWRGPGGSGRPRR